MSDIFDVCRFCNQFNDGEELKMFCPSCGTEERHSNQFCRACGTDLRGVRFSFGRADKITDSAASARDEIGRAVAQRIQTIKTSDLGHFAEEVLPEIEKFLESPEEKRLRRVRVGSLIAFIGLGAALAFGTISYADDKFLFFAALGCVALFVGLGFLANGLFFTVPKKTIPDKTSEAEKQRELDYLDPQTSELILPEARQEFVSVVEDTTRQLQKQTARKK